MAITVTLADGGTATLTGAYKRWVKATITASSGSEFGAYSFWADSERSSSYNQQYLYSKADSSLDYDLTFQIASYGPFVKYFWLQYAGEISYDIQLRNSSGTVVFSENYTKGITGGGGSGGGSDEDAPDPVKLVIDSTKTTTTDVTVCWTVEADYGSTIAYLFEGGEDKGDSGNKACYANRQYETTFTGLSADTEYTIKAFHNYNGGQTVSSEETVLTDMQKFYWTDSDDKQIAYGKKVSAITADQWNNLQKIFNRVLEREGSSRAQYVAEVERDDIIYASTFNDVRQRLVEYSREQVPEAVSGGKLTSEHFTKLRDALNKCIDTTNSNH